MTNREVTDGMNYFRELLYIVKQIFLSIKVKKDACNDNARNITFYLSIIKKELNNTLRIIS